MGYSGNLTDKTLKPGERRIFRRIHTSEPDNIFGDLTFMSYRGLVISRTKNYRLETKTFYVRGEGGNLR